MPSDDLVIYSQKQVMDALDRAETLLSELFEGESIPEMEQDFLNIFINAVVTVLKQPDDVDDLDDVLNINWAESDFDTESYDSPAEWVRSWWGEWS